MFNLLFLFKFLENFVGGGMMLLICGNGWNCFFFKGFICFEEVRSVVFFGCELCNGNVVV